MGIVWLEIVIILIIIFTLYFIMRFSHSKNRPYYLVNTDKDPILKIAVLGDSWANGKKLDPILHQVLTENGFENKIISSGQSGAKSSLIYYNLFKDTDEKYSSRFIIENRPDYCVLLAGINDAVGQVGGRYYSHHMVKIIKTLLHYNIKPVIVSLPKVGIKAFLNRTSFFKKYRNIVSAYLNNNGIIDNIESYRKKMNELLNNEKLRDKIILVDFDSACEGFTVNPGLYSNPIHLSKEGIEKLGLVVADALIKELKLNNKSQWNKQSKNETS
jgi:lysophospholipase L1-like esterase